MEKQVPNWECPDNADADPEKIKQAAKSMLV